MEQSSQTTCWQMPIVSVIELSRRTYASLYHLCSLSPGFGNCMVKNVLKIAFSKKMTSVGEGYQGRNDSYEITI